MVMYDSTDFTYLPIDGKVESQMSCVLANQLIVIVYLIRTTVIKLGQSDVLFNSQ